MKFRLENQADWDKFSTYLAGCKENSVYEVEIVEKRVRTNTQNNCIHDYCAAMAKELNESGYSYSDHVENIKKNGDDVPWGTDNFKKDVWHRVQKAIFPEAVNSDGTPSTAALTTDQVSNVYDYVNAKMANYGVSMPWPDRFNKG